MQDLLGTDQPDADALRWTMEFLTKDIELEIRIEGITILRYVLT